MAWSKWSGCCCGNNCNVTARICPLCFCGPPNSFPIPSYVDLSTSIGTISGWLIASTGTGGSPLKQLFTGPLSEIWYPDTDVLASGIITSHSFDITNIKNSGYCNLWMEYFYPNDSEIILGGAPGGSIGAVQQTGSGSYARQVSFSVACCSGGTLDGIKLRDWNPGTPCFWESNLSGSPVTLTWQIPWDNFIGNQNYQGILFGTNICSEPAFSTCESIFGGGGFFCGTGCYPAPTTCYDIILLSNPSTITFKINKLYQISPGIYSWVSDVHKRLAWVQNQTEEENINCDLAIGVFPIAPAENATLFLYYCAATFNVSCGGITANICFAYPSGGRLQNQWIGPGSIEQAMNLYNSLPDSYDANDPDISIDVSSSFDSYGPTTSGFSCPGNLTFETHWFTQAAYTDPCGCPNTPFHSGYRSLSMKQ